MKWCQAGLTPYEFAFKSVEIFEDEDVKLKFKEMAQILEEYSSSKKAEDSLGDHGKDGGAIET